MYCQITGQTVFGRVLRFLVFYIPLWICIFYNAVTYFKVIRLVRRTQRLADYSSRRGVHLGEKAAQVSNSANKVVNTSCQLLLVPGDGVFHCQL